MGLGAISISYAVRRFLTLVLWIACLTIRNLSAFKGIFARKNTIKLAIGTFVTTFVVFTQ